MIFMTHAHPVYIACAVVALLHRELRLIQGLQVMSIRNGIRHVIIHVFITSLARFISILVEIPNRCLILAGIYHAVSADDFMAGKN